MTCARSRHLASSTVSPRCCKRAAPKGIDGWRWSVTKINGASLDTGLWASQKSETILTTYNLVDAPKTPWDAAAGTLVNNLIPDNPENPWVDVLALASGWASGEPSSGLSDSDKDRVVLTALTTGFFDEYHNSPGRRTYDANAYNDYFEPGGGTFHLSLFLEGNDVECRSASTFLLFSAAAVGLPTDTTSQLGQRRFQRGDLDKFTTNEVLVMGEGDFGKWKWVNHQHFRYAPDVGDPRYFDNLLQIDEASPHNPSDLTPNEYWDAIVDYFPVSAFYPIIFESPDFD